MFDEMSLQYWEKHRQKVGSSKDYSCVHNGYVYGDNMTFSKIDYVYYDDGQEYIFEGVNPGPKWAYFSFVEQACKQSDSTLKSFLNNPAKKFRIYTEAQVAAFSEPERRSTRIKDDNCKIMVNNKPYFVAHNLKVCEYFNSAAINTVESEKNKWFIRIYFDDNEIKHMVDSAESEAVDYYLPEFEVVLEKSPKKKTTKGGASLEFYKKVDYLRLNQTKKAVGDLGESIVLAYEINRLKDAGLIDLAARVEHTAVEKGDGYGYDIMSYDNNGTPIFIEVKSTKQNKPDEFYLSKKERQVAEEMLDNGEKYYIYRLYNINTKTGKCKMVIYDQPISEKQFSFEAENYLVKLKDSGNP